MQEFTISPQGLQLLEKKLTRNSVITLVVVIAIVFVINVFIIGHADQTFMYVGILMVGVLGFSSFNNLKKHKKMFATYKLTVSDDRIIREMDGTPSITILKAEVKDILKSKSGALGIVGNSKLNAIGVPAEVDNIVALEGILGEIKPIRINNTGDLIQKYQWIIIAPAVVSMFFMMTSKNAIFSIGGSLSLVVVMLWGFVVIQRSKNIEKRVKRMSYVSLLPILSFLLLAIMKIVESIG